MSGETGTRLEFVLEEFRPEITAAAGAKVAVRIDVERDLPCVAADATQLELALLSLVVRARNTMRNGGTLAITASSTRYPPVVDRNVAAPTVRLSVCDTGDGSDEPTIPRTGFQLWKRNACQDKSERLELAQRLLASFGGLVTFASLSDVGVRVDLWLPTA